MKNNITIIALTVVLAALVGLGIFKSNRGERLIRELLGKQTIMLQAQARLEQKFSAAGSEGMGTGAQNSFLMQKINDLEARIIALETRVQGGPRGNPGDAARNAPPPEDTTVYEIAIAHSPVRGSKNAPVTIVEFVDFQCPFCARFHQPILDVLKAYPDKVNYILKNFPLSFHPEAKPAAKAAFAAGEQGKYWEMADALLENNRELTEEKFKEIAGTLGLNVEKFMNDYKNKDAQWEQYIQSDMDLGQQVNVQGTPTFYLNGKKTRSRDLNSFKVEIDAILGGKK
ncbi:MAG TPA: thioredoxin domain-containing protein [Candidatus Omnitrophota bacterium]|nr:thioredoxin domain-containing protein [Candidatus Omnitrophota bacterium]